MATGVDRGVVGRARWAYLSDYDEVEKNELIDASDNTVVVVIRSVYGSACVAMRPEDTVESFNFWLEKTKGIKINSFVLSHNAVFLTRRQTLQALAPACILQLTSRVENNGLPRGLPVANVKTKKSRGDNVAPQATA